VNPHSDHPSMGTNPQPHRHRSSWHGRLALVLVVLIGTSGVASAKRKRKGKGDKPAPAAAAPAPDAEPAAPPDDATPTLGGRDKPEKGDKPKVFDFTGLGLEGRLRTPQLLYFLDRASEELEQASLERRSFIPEMVRSLDEDGL
jgi:hypothetical protein